MTGSRLHYCWKNMLARCKDTTRKSYGQKGIAVCDDWRSFSVFAEWATQSGYRDDLTIERKDNDLGYCPENCTWATPKQQARHRSIVRTKHDGTAWAAVAEEYGVAVTVMNNRISSGNWTVEAAAETPIGSVRKLPERGADGKFISGPKTWRR